MIHCHPHPPGGLRLLLYAACAVLAAACGTSAHAAPPQPPTPPRPPTAPHPPILRRPMVLVAPGDLGPALVAVRRGQLGVELVEITPELREHFGAPRDAGVLVARITPNGPAAKAGVRVGDVITAVDGQKIDGDADVRRQIRGKKDKEVASLELLRNRARQTIKAQVEQKDTSELDLGDVIERRGRRVIIDPDRIDGLVDRAMRAADFPARIERRREMEEKLQQRTQALEQRLERLERELREKK
jgi:membrane-associated protease RseP (regulator of RpoE activity)